MASKQNVVTTVDPWSFRHSFQHPWIPDPKTEALTNAIHRSGGGGGKVAKRRKSRASKLNHTTFIAADPANFRHMVQQLTGVGFGHSQPVFKPDPQRPATRFPVSAGLPTLDTSPFLLNHHQSSGSGSEITGPGFGLPNNNAQIRSDFDTFSSFPTLESWKAVM